MSTPCRPPSYCCGPSCPTAHHEAIRRLLNALEETLAACDALTDMNPPKDAGAREKWRQMTEDVWALVYVAGMVTNLIEGPQPTCCHSDRAAGLGQ